jgi:plastocyanin
VRRKWLTALLFGFAIAFAIGQGAATAADNSVVALITNSWGPRDVTIQVGDSVTWSNPEGGVHNVCVAPRGRAAGECSGINNEFRNGVPKPYWDGNDTNSHVFLTPGTYNFICETHSGSGMAGTITVGAPPTPPAAPSEPEPTTEAPAPTPAPVTLTRTVATPAPAKKKVAPRFVGKLARKADKKTIVVNLGASKAATLKTKITRKNPGQPKFVSIGSASSKVKKGRNLVKLPRKAAGSMKKGSYKLTVYLSAGGLKSKTRSLKFRVK